MSNIFFHLIFTQKWCFFGLFIPSFGIWSTLISVKMTKLTKIMRFPRKMIWGNWMKSHTPTLNGRCMSLKNYSTSTWRIVNKKMESIIHWSQLIGWIFSSLLNFIQLIHILILLFFCEKYKRFVWEKIANFIYFEIQCKMNFLAMKGLLLAHDFPIMRSKNLHFSDNIKCTRAQDFCALSRLPFQCTFENFSYVARRLIILNIFRLPLS